jgi:23S rRNA pseudouridine1911/1915/1917 synthase
VEGGLLHRLDRETSGLVLAARDQAAFDALMELSESGGILKRYSAVCRPSFSPAPGRRELLAPLGWTIHAWAEILHALDSGPTWPTMTIRSAFRAYGPGRRLVAAVTESAAGSVYETRLSAIEPVPAAESAFAARVELRRGFRHQVRCHLASVGLPLIGDPLYGPPGAAGRLLLHAESLEFSDPLTGEARSFRLPADWGADRHGG